MADLFGIGQIVGSVIDAGASIFNSERNLDYAKDNLAYQKELQNRIFAREDNAVQRRAADLKAAGFNPLLAAGGAASSGAAVSTTAPQSNIKTDFASTAMALHRMKIDNSMTQAQQQLLTEQRNHVIKQNELLQKQIDWYDKHPEFAPSVPQGMTSPSMLDYLGGRIHDAYTNMFVRGSASGPINARQAEYLKDKRIAEIVQETGRAARENRAPRYKNYN